MKRKKLKRLVQKLLNEVEQKSYEYWKVQEYPIVTEEEFEGEIAQVEIYPLESKDEYFNILVSADGGGLSAYFPVAQNTIIYK